MVEEFKLKLLSGILYWLEREPTVVAVTLFGSRARSIVAPAAADGWSDFDLQIVTSAPEKLFRTDWAAMVSSALCMQVLRPATSGVRKLTLLFAEGEVDLVIVPTWQLRAARAALALGLHRRISRVSEALNNLSTIMGGGYRMLKGERGWGPFYARVVADLPGYRLSEREVIELADCFVCDFHGVLQKIQRGELVAAQRTLHRSLLETNIMLRHEARIRAGVPTFREARRVEQLLGPEELQTVQVSARLEYDELLSGAWTAFSGLKSLMHDIAPQWRISAGMEALLAPWKREADSTR